MTGHNMLYLSIKLQPHTHMQQLEAVWRGTNIHVRQGRCLVTVDPSPATVAFTAQDPASRVLYPTNHDIITETRDTRYTRMTDRYIDSYPSLRIPMVTTFDEINILARTLSRYTRHALE